ncbi:MAG: flagellar biosynthetic protein FliO [Blastocatellia bacterium]
MSSARQSSAPGRAAWRWLAGCLALLIAGCNCVVVAQPGDSPAASVSPSPQSARQEQPGDDRLPFMASQRTRERELTGTEQPSVAGLLLRTFGALLLIVGLIFAGAWWVRRYGGARFGQGRKDAPALEVLSTVSLGERRSLSVVRFGQSTLLIGSTAQGLTLLATRPADEAQAEEAGHTPARVSVADLLSREETRTEFEQELAQAELRNVNIQSHLHPDS